MSRRIARALLALWLAAPAKAFAHAADPADTAHARQVLDEVLQQKEYLDARRNAEWTHWFLNELTSLLRSLFGHVFHVGGAAPGLIDMVGAFLMAVLVVLLALLLARTLRRSGGVGAAATAAEEMGETQRLDTADEWLRLADSRASGGDFHHAMRCVYVALLKRLEEQGVVRFEAGQTNWELVRQLRGTWRWEPLSEATRLFDSHWYGVRPAGEGEYQKLRGIFAQLGSAAP